MALTLINPNKNDRPQDFEDERCENGLFRCQRCEMLWPLPFEWQDGFRLCQRCQDPGGGAEEVRAQFAEEKAANASAPYDVLTFQPRGAFNGAVMVTGVSPLTLNLTRGGASGSIAITGVNLSTADTWAASNVNITVTPTVNSTTSVTLSISAAVGTPRANYNLTFNSDTLTPRGILKVR